LPGRWGRIDLRSEKATRSSIRRVVEDATGRADSLAPLRAELRKRFEAVALEARDGNAVEVQIAREIAPGLPLAASLAVLLPDVDVSELDGLGLAALTDLLGATAPREDREGPLRHEVQFERVRAVRQIQRRQPVLEGEPMPIIQADYWVAAARPARLTLFSFTTPLIELETEMLELFDAVIGTIRWSAA
jgi:hypothetical protein